MTFRTKIGGVLARVHPQKIGTPHLFLQPLKLATSNLVHNLGLGSSLSRNNFYNQNWRGGGQAKGASKICRDPLFIFATTEASNFKFGILLGLGSSLPRNNFQYKCWWGCERGSIEKIQNPLLLSATVEASNFKFCTQLQFGEYVTITPLVPNLAGTGWPTEAPQKLWVSGTPYHVPCTT